MNLTLSNLKLLFRLLALLVVTGTAIAALPTQSIVKSSSNSFQSTLKQETILEFRVERRLLE